jgi:hypothetical protein
MKKSAEVPGDHSAFAGGRKVGLSHYGMCNNISSALSGARPADLKLRLAGNEDQTMLGNFEDIT